MRVILLPGQTQRCSRQMFGVLTNPQRLQLSPRQTHSDGGAGGLWLSCRPRLLTCWNRGSASYNELCLCCVCRLLPPSGWKYVFKLFQIRVFFLGFKVSTVNPVIRLGGNVSDHFCHKGVKLQLTNFQTSLFLEEKKANKNKFNILKDFLCLQSKSCLTNLHVRH